MLLWPCVVLLTQENEHAPMLGGCGCGVKEVAVPGCASLLPAVGGRDQQGQRPTHELFTHLRDALTVPATAVVHALA